MNTENMVWYSSPAGKWEDALPIGNGRMGGMVYGGVKEDQIHLNDDTLYGGAPMQRVNPAARKTLDAVRELLRQGRLDEARTLAQAGLVATPRYAGPYLPLCTLFLRFEGRGEVTDYRRELDIGSAVARTTFTKDGVHFTREYIASYPANVIAIRLTADQPGAISLYANMMRRPYDPGTRITPEGRLLMQGRATDGGVEYDCMVEARAEGGVVETIGDTLHISRADSATIYIASDTSFRGAFPEAECALTLNNAPDYDKLLAEHIADYRALYERVSLNLGEGHPDVPTNERIHALREGGHDEGLLALTFNFGRYLLIACSRPGSMAANLQGIWNDLFAPPWDSIFTVNINTEMNYWLSGPGNLNELAEPLFDLLSGESRRACVSGAGGYMAHRHRRLRCGRVLWHFGAAWLSLGMGALSVCLDRQKPRKNCRCDAAAFFTDYLIEDRRGCLIAGAPRSPGNMVRHTNGGVVRCAPADGPARLLRALFDGGGRG